MAYCTKAQAVALTGGFDSIDTNFIQDDWLTFVDALIEQYMGQGYKGATRTASYVGENTSLLRLPSKAASITEITEAGTLQTTTLDPATEYILETSGRLVERQNTTYPQFLYPYYSRTGKWWEGYRYVVTYVEPGVADGSQAPDTWKACAAECVATIALHAKKRTEFGAALSASDAGSAGKVSTAASTSFPASLMDELERTIQRSLAKSRI